MTSKYLQNDTDLPVLIGPKLAKNAKIEKFKCDILSNFQTMWALGKKINFGLFCHDFQTVSNSINPSRILNFFPIYEMTNNKKVLMLQFRKKKKNYELALKKRMKHADVGSLLNLAASLMCHEHSLLFIVELSFSRYKRSWTRGR